MPKDMEGKRLPRTIQELVTEQGQTVEAQSTRSAGLMDRANRVLERSRDIIERVKFRNLERNAGPNLPDDRRTIIHKLREDRERLTKEIERLEGLDGVLPLIGDGPVTD